MTQPAFRAFIANAKLDLPGFDAFLDDQKARIQAIVGANVECVLGRDDYKERAVDADGKKKLSWAQWIDSIFGPLHPENPSDRTKRFDYLIVPQTPNDEPGCILLGRATAEMLRKGNALGRQMYAWGKRPGEAVEGLWPIASVDTINASAWKAGWKLRF